MLEVGLKTKNLAQLYELEFGPDYLTKHAAPLYIIRICTPSLISGASFIRQENSNRLGSVSYQYRSVLHTTQNVPLLDITNENLGLSPFIDLNNDDVKDVLLLIYSSNHKYHLRLLKENVIDLKNFRKYVRTNWYVVISILDLSLSAIFDHRADDQVPVTTLKRKRGRPKKILGSMSTSTELEKITVTPTPYMNISSDLLDHTVDGQLPFTELKRKCGRPKKVLGSTSTQTDLEKITVNPTPYPTISSEILDHTADDQVPLTSLKRKRGRPKKKIIGSTSTQNDTFMNIIILFVNYIIIFSGVDFRDQVPPTNQKKKHGRPKKVLASTSAQSEYWDMGDANVECMYCGVMF
ncbi:HMG (high mobility group) box protein withARID/BRIGHT DNA-binding domain, partial [Striga asiatica]